jgi:DNA modification methylase
MSASRYLIQQGDVTEVLRTLPDNSVDALFCDPPYGFSFMGKSWDYQVPQAPVWREALRVLKPGAPLLAFGGSRTYHRLACAIEDGGFELRDCLMWLHGKGFPKSLDAEKALAKKAPENDLTEADWHGHGTALKPAHEPIALARKPLEGTLAENIRRWGVGPIAIDASRIGEQVYSQEEWNQKSLARTSGAAFGVHKGSTGPVPQGRWPANLLLDEHAAEALDEQTGDRVSRPAVTRNGGGGRIFNGGPDEPRPDSGYSDSGGASRFFYTTKASRKEREKGCEHLPLRSAAEMTDSEEGQARLDSPRTGAGRTGGARNHHPTVKPIDLVRYLSRLILPPTPDPVLLVPFSGSGSEMIGALLAGWPFVLGIERDPEYIQIAHARLAAHVQGLERAA